MNEEKYKEYIANKTTADVMEEYSNQHDEWQTIPEEVTIGTKKFLCKEYSKEYIIDNKIFECLSGKSIEQQLKYYYVTESYDFYSTAYGDITSEDLKEQSINLGDYDKVQELLFKGNILIGAKIKAWPDSDILLPNKCVCTYYACDNDGSGTNEREDYAYLIFRD